jgi:hypothetical protein
MAGAAIIVAEAGPPTFQITSLHSNLDGSAQFIRLTEMAGLDGQHYLAGLTLTSTHNGVAKTFTFPRDLPTEHTTHASVVIAVGYGYVVSKDGSVVWLGAEYGLPARFLATDGGVVDFAGVDLVSYAHLPTDGEKGLLRDGTVTHLLLPTSLCRTWRCNGESAVWPDPVAAVEYYHPGMDHYFISASAPDIDALDSGRTGGWHRTGHNFSVAASAAGFATYVWDDPFIHIQSSPLCRFYIPPESGDSHFISASGAECADVRSRFPTFVLESDATFYAVLPNPTTGGCPRVEEQWGSVFELVPVFRLWNTRADSNHRYTIDPAVRSAMIDQGYVSEGHGPLGVVFCVPG